VEPDQLTPVYDWLIYEGFPWDWRPVERPGWIDVRRLAARWQATRDFERMTTDEIVAEILDRTGWGDE
jgi:hypothetical protein